MKKKLAMILILLLIGMSVLPISVALATGDEQAVSSETAEDENKTTTATQNGNGESAASQRNAQEKNIFNTGTDPLWSFVKLEAPEEALVGQEFEVNITVKNMGTGSGMFPEFRFYGGKR